MKLRIPNLPPILGLIVTIQTFIILVIGYWTDKSKPIDLAILVVIFGILVIVGLFVLPRKPGKGRQLMSKYKFDDTCKGCKPVLFNINTGKILPDDHPHMVAMNKIWDQQTLEVKEAWHKTTCRNSKDPKDILLAKTFAESIDKAIYISDKTN